MVRDPNRITVAVVNVSCYSIFAAVSLIELWFGWKRLLIACRMVIYHWATAHSPPKQSVCVLNTKPHGMWCFSIIVLRLVSASSSSYLEGQLISLWARASADWTIRFSLWIPIQFQCISRTVHVWGGDGWRKWSKDESRSFEVFV